MAEDLLIADLNTKIMVSEAEAPEMSAWKEGSCRQFDAWSKSYDRSILQRIFFGPAHDQVIRQLPTDQPFRLLDVGCGTGRLLSKIVLSRPMASGIGIDLSHQMLEKAMQNCPKVGDRLQLLEGDSERLPFGDNSFDYVTCVHSFHHYPNQQRVVNEIFRVLKPGGKLLLVDGNRDQWWGWVLYDGIVTTIERNVHHCSGKEFVKLSTTAGHPEVKLHRHGLFTPYLLVSATKSQPAATVQPVAKAA